MSFEVLKGIHFVASTTSAEYNWFGYEWFEVLGPVGKLTAPSHANSSGEPSEIADQIWLRCEYGITTLNAYELYELISDFVYAPVGSKPLRRFQESEEHAQKDLPEDLPAAP